MPPHAPRAWGTTLTVGLSAYGMPAEDLLDLAVASDEAGFDTLWIGEHVVLPTGYGSEHPTHAGLASQHHTGPIIDPDTELVEPLVMLSAIAAVTSRLHLATGICLAPLRHPLLLARAACTVADVSGERLVLGLGAGWLREEFDALGVPFASRMERLEEAIGILRAAFSGGAFDHVGAHFRFGMVQVTPRPINVPVVVGGNTERALRRAVSMADGWFSSGTPGLDDARRLVDRLLELAGDHGRIEPLRCFVRVAGFDPDLIGQYRAAGIDDIVVWADQVWPAGTLAERQRRLAGAAAELGLPGR